MGLGVGVGGAGSTLAQQQQGVTEEKAKSGAENVSPTLSHALATLSGFPFPLVLLPVQPHGARFWGEGCAVGLLEKENNRERSQESIGIKIKSFAVRQT